MTTAAVKRWSVSVVADGRTALRYHCGGEAFEAAAGVVEKVSPVEHLLMSVAGCFALSARAVIAQRKFAPASFEVVVSGEKAPDLPSRLARIEVSVNFDTAVSPDDAESITADAKSLCTVSNSISAAPPITYAHQRMSLRSNTRSI